MRQSTDMHRRGFIKTAGLAAAGAALAPWPRLALAGDLPPEQRAQRLAELMDEGRLFERGGRRVYRGDQLEAISLPLGGIAAGPIQINGEARRHLWQIFRNYAGVALPDSFFAVRAQAGEAEPVERVLQTVGEGALAPMRSLSFSGEYPFGWYAFEDPDLPVRVQMEVFSPLIPLNAKDSGIPCAIFQLTAENTGSASVNVTFLATQQNPIGYRDGTPLEGRRGATYGGNVNRVLRAEGGLAVHLHSTRAKDDPTYGDLALATPASEARATAQWDSTVGFGFAEVAEAGPTPAGETVDAALAVPFALAPGEKRTVAFVLAWHFANTRFKAKTWHVGNQYANGWPDALAVARDVVQRLEPLTAQTRLYHETLYRTNLPRWLLDRISSQVAILGSLTCHWAKDGFFYAVEGCNPKSGCCGGNATHVWGYPQAHARLFPEIARRMREETFALMKPDGMITVRFSKKFPAFDGICHEITATLREHQLSTDPAWLGRQWPALTKALDYLIQRWDADQDGLLAGPQHGMDGEHGGTTSWLGGTYLCALAAAAAMARIQQDLPAAARYEKILQAGRASQDRALFNGEWFVQVPDPTPREDYLTGCYTDQMLGQWWAHQVGLGWLYPPDHVRAAMASLFRYNFRTDFRDFQQAPRVFCAADDAGMIQGTWPRGGKPLPPNCIRYTEEVMSGFEYCVAGLAIQCGLPREGFAILRAAADRYDGRLRRMPSTGEYAKGDYTNWGYSGNPFGDDECGKFYARAMSIWGVLVACQGFTCDAATAAIGFAPTWKPEDHVSFFTAAEGWGCFTQKIAGGRQTAVLEIAHGRLRVKTLALATPKQPTAVRVNLAGKDVAAKQTFAAGRLTVVLEADATIAAGQQLEVILS